MIRRMLLSPLRLTWSAVVLTVCVIIDVALVTILVKKRLAQRGAQTLTLLTYLLYLVSASSRD